MDETKWLRLLLVVLAAASVEAQSRVRTRQLQPVDDSLTEDPDAIGAGPPDTGFTSNGQTRTRVPVRDEQGNRRTGSAQQFQSDNGESNKLHGKTPIFKEFQMSAIKSYCTNVATNYCEA